jgi:diguanylate cyclase (GGDEF)-like protein
MSHFLTAEPAQVVLDFLTQALDGMDVGILLLDRDMRVRFVNRRQTELFGLPADLLATRPTFRDLMEHNRAKSWIVPPAGDYAEFIARREAAVRAGSLPPTHIDLRDGTRLLFACKTCPDGGRILTYTDISRELRPEALDAMEKINAELRFNTETMEDHAAHLANLAEQTDESIRKVEEAKQELEHEIAERRELEARLRRMATTDGLTGALNRSGFMALGQAEVDREARPGQPLALLMLDIDHFKSINDRYGHAGGDVALQHLVMLLGGRIRRSDLLGRLGGEEFAILLPAIPPEEAERMAERLVALVAGSPVIYRDRPIGMTVSIGLTMAISADRSLEQIIMRADDALYRAKASGRNRVVIDHPAEAVGMT